MKFAHIADCHIGGWREPKLKDISTQSFVWTVDYCIRNRMDFVLISGDLFNTAIPGIDKLKIVVRKLKELKDKDVRVYMIAGSHDFSPSGRTMIDVLETAGLVINVVKGNIVDGKLRLEFTKDPTRAKITGMLGRRGSLETAYYEDLDREHLEKEEGFKIFMFHTAITELKTKELEQMESAPVSLMPKGFDYYAGGHVHIRKQYDDEDYRNVIYPGPLFPNSFSELEKLEHGGFYVYDGRPKQIPIELMRVQTISVKGNSVEEINEHLHEATRIDPKDSIITIRVAGKLSSGRVADIRFKGIYDDLYQRGAYFIMKNTAGIKVLDFEEVKVHEESVQEIEKKILREHLGSDTGTAEKLMQSLSQTKNQGEKTYEFEERLKKDIDLLLGL